MLANELDMSKHIPTSDHTNHDVADATACGYNLTSPEQLRILPEYAHTQSYGDVIT